MSDKQYHDFFSLYVVVVFFPKDYSGSGKEASMNQKQIGLFLKELRKQKGLTQGQLAEMLGVSDRSVSRWENGNNMPDLSILVFGNSFFFKKHIRCFFRSAALFP